MTKKIVPLWPVIIKKKTENFNNFLPLIVQSARYYDWTNSWISFQQQTAIQLCDARVAHQLELMYKSQRAPRSYYPSNRELRSSYQVLPILQQQSILKSLKNHTLKKKRVIVLKLKNFRFRYIIFYFLFCKLTFNSMIKAYLLIYWFFSCDFLKKDHIWVIKKISFITNF